MGTQEQKEAWLIVVESARNALDSIESENYKTIEQMALGSIIFAFDILDFNLSSARHNISTSENLSREEAAKHIGVKTQTLANWAHSGREKIPFRKIRGKATYLRSDLDAYLISIGMSEAQ
ncbi:helix-turn-helix domain-containing protein [Ewingella sp. S1.OA.A_B6]